MLGASNSEYRLPAALRFMEKEADTPQKLKISPFGSGRKSLKLFFADENSARGKSYKGLQRYHDFLKNEELSKEVNFKRNLKECDTPYLRRRDIKSSF